MSKNRETIAKPVIDENELTNKFVEEFEALLEKHGIKEYVFNCTIDKGIILYKPDDIMAITKKLKIMHQQFFGRVLESCGENR